MANTDKPGRLSGYWDFFVKLLIFFAFLIVGLPIALAIGYLLLGINSVGYYGPPIGDVMAFVYKATTLLAAALIPLFALLAFLYSMKPFRRRMDGFLERLTPFEAGADEFQYTLTRFRETVERPIPADWGIRLLHPIKPIRGCRILYDGKDLPWWDVNEPHYIQLTPTGVVVMFAFLVEWKMMTPRSSSRMETGRWRRLCSGSSL